MVTFTWLSGTGTESRQLRVGLRVSGVEGYKHQRLGSVAVADGLTRSLTQYPIARRSHTVKMFATKFILALLLSFSAAACASQNVDKKPPAAPSLSFLYSLNCTLADPVLVGAGPHGQRVVIPIIGGTFSGPKLSGKHIFADTWVRARDAHSGSNRQGAQPRGGLGPRR